MAGSGADAAESAVTATGQEATPVAALTFDLVRGAIYHRSRVVWFAALHRVGMFLTILASTGAVAAITSKDTGLAIGVSLAAAVISAANLAFDFAGLARKHDECRRPYHEIAADLEEAGARPADEVIRRLRARMIRAAATEPATFNAVLHQAHNAAIRSLGRDRDNEFVLSAWQRLASRILPQSAATFQTRRELDRSH